MGEGRGGTSRRQEVVVGVDVGTTLIKAAAFDRRGRVVARAQAATACETPRPGWVEVEMEGLWRQVAATLGALAGRLGGGQPVRAIGIGAFMGGAWLIDRAGRPVRNAIPWHDGRAVGVLDELREARLLDRSFAVSCNALTPGFALVLLRWLRDHEPAVLDRARTLLFAKDWLRFRLTGELATDESDASHAPGDALQRGFSLALLADWGLGGLSGLLPPVLPSGAVAGRVTAAAAAATGMPAGTPVVTGLADVSAALVGGGVVGAGQAGTIIGSSCLNSVVTEQPVWEPAGVGLSFLIPPAAWTRTMPNQTGTLAFDWFRREFGAEGMDAAALEAAVATVPRGARGVLFHPYLNATGVLAPAYEPRARGRLSGLGLEHTRWDILRAIYEGLAFAVADCLDLLPAFAEPITLLGGGGRNAVLRQIVADVTGRAFAPADNAEPGALGVALLAGVAAGWWGSPEQAVAACCSLGAPTLPDPDAHAEYQPRLEQYRHVRRGLLEEQETQRALRQRSGAAPDGR